MTVGPLEARHREAFGRMFADYSARDPENGESYRAGEVDFDAFASRLADEERGVDLPDGYVPCSHRWLEEGGEIVGIVRVRHHIDTPFLMEEGGHIGYDVPPSFRGRGNGIACLRAGLDEARRLGLPRVLLTADESNVPSWRTIERCGGQLERTDWSDHYGCLVRRYWIELSAPG